MRWPALACLAAALLAAGCGSSAGAGSGARGGTLTVFAASSLTEAFARLARVFERAHPGWKVRLDFGGSDVLAAQIEQGAPADVYAAASPRYTSLLARKGLVGHAAAFAANRLELIVPAADPARIRRPADLERGASLVIGDAAVPIGAYTRQVLRNLGIPLRRLHVVSQEQDVKDIVAKVALAEADAGIVYVTDARAAGEEVRGIRLPPAAQASVRYPIALVKGSGNEEAGRWWIELVRGTRGRRVLRGFGFAPAPSR